MGRACSMYRRQDQVHTEFWWGDVSGGDHLENLVVDGRIK